MMPDIEKTSEDHIREGAKFVAGVAFSEKPFRFNAELLYQRVLMGLESMLYGHLVARGVQPYSHNAAGLAAEFGKLEVADEFFCLNLLAFSKIQSMHSDRPSSETPFPLGIEEVQAQARTILEILGPDGSSRV